MSSIQHRSGSVRVPIAILGAGVTGLSAAYHARSKYRLFEARDRVGGAASSFHVGPWRFDHAIHVLFTRDPYAASLLRFLLGDDLVKHIRNAAVFSAGTFTKYPYQAHQRGLPAEIIEENILGLIDRPARPAQNFRDWIDTTYGSGIAKNFMVPYNRKVWTTELASMSTDWIDGRVPKVEVRDVLRSVLSEDTTEYGPNAEFWYPRVGGMQRLPDAFVEAGVRAECGCRVTSIDTNQRSLNVENAGRVDYDSLISTLPLPVLVSRLCPSVPRLTQLTSMLTYNRVVTVNIGARRANTKAMHWVYVPDETVPFQRYSVPSNFSEDCAPSGCTTLITETSQDLATPLDLDRLMRETIRSLETLGVLDEADIELAVPHVIEPAYVVPTITTRDIVEEILAELSILGIESCGRFGSWEYLNMDQSILQGKLAAESVVAPTIECYE